MTRPAPIASAPSAPSAPSTPAATAAAATPDDPYLWLEEVEGERALTWVKARNAESDAALRQAPGSRYAQLEPRIRAALEAKDRIPAISRRGGHVYNFWQDEAHPRGLWRRTTLAEYRRAEPAWELLLDLDALGRAEGENWVWKGAHCLAPQWNRCLLKLSRGGADAVVVREWDLAARAFVPGGFSLPEAKSDVSWLDEDHLLVGTNFGPGSLTESGYPRLVKRWRRGTPLAEAVQLFAGEPGDVSAWAQVERRPGLRRVTLGRSLDFYSQTVQLLDEASGRLQPLAKPDDAELDLHGPWASLRLRSAWTTPDGQAHPAGSLLLSPAADYLAGKPAWQAVFTPSPTVALDQVDWTQGHLVLVLLDNVAARVETRRWQAVDGSATPGRSGRWIAERLELPGPGTLSVASLDDDWAPADDPLAESLLVNYVDFLTPDSLLRVDLRQRGARPEVLKQRPAQFDASRLQVQQHLARSADGTAVPYFIVQPKAAAGATASHTARPTLLYGYGGFEISLQPWYSATWGQAWYEAGGQLVVANIRGGGEFGPDWHQAAIKANKQRSYDDFIAVAEDLQRRGLTTRQQLGIMGGSNGGLLVGAVYTQRPELFGAMVCQVPLLDMRRYHRLLAGASWMAEYGDPDRAEDWAWISTWSPYQKLKPGTSYPPALFTTSTRDDRVHPGHARKMVARLRELGQPVQYYENIEGGHGGAADNRQRAHLQALEFSFLWQQLGGGR
ncbi:MAG: hypothetical protein RL722_2843 [Pseudomonadota bacterium]